MNAPRRQLGDQLPATFGRLPTAYCLLPTPRLHSGVSLLEVLISIFIIMFGLLGVAAVLPLGSRNVAEIVRADNSSACGTGALRDMRAWQVLDPNNWRQPVYTSVSPAGWKLTTQVLQIYNNESDRKYLPYGQSFAIDPLFVARAARTFTPTYPPTATSRAQEPRVPYFPYDPETQPSDRPDYWKLYMRRVTIPLANASVGWVEHDAFYSRFSTWHDDPDIPLPTHATERPRQMFFCTDGASRVLPKLATDPVVNPLPSLAEIQGDYTWMAIITPSLTETGGMSTSDWNRTTDVAAENVVPSATDTSLRYWQRTQYLAQIVVFHKRDFALPTNYFATEEPPAERTVRGNILTDGYGGGDISLSVRAINPDKYSHYLSLRKDQWIMLAGQTTKGNVFRWYRVVSPGDPPVSDGTDWSRYVTLAGPDWDLAWCRNTNEVAAIIADGVVGVYSMTFEIDRDSQVKILWP